MRGAGSCIAALLVGVAVLAGCGGDDEGGMSETTGPAAEKLTRAEIRTFQDGEQRIQEYCIAVAASRTGQGEVPSVEEQKNVFAALDDLIDVVIAKPNAEVRPGLDARFLLDELAENLEGSNCDSRLVERMDAALASLEG